MLVRSLNNMKWDEAKLREQYKNEPENHLVILEDRPLSACNHELTTFSKKYGILVQTVLLLPRSAYKNESEATGS